MQMYNPPYPAEMIREDILPELGLSVTQAAKQLGVNRVTLSRLLNGKSAISADMAIRLHKWLGENSPSPESWLHQQATYDLWVAEQKQKDYQVTPINISCV
ncbi:MULTISPECIES: HigA family addiction module antitoxin [Phocoenobacter]|uniref:Addiction module antidote protein, HigA family n=1 Tax=Phocoenobacter skyensis TaxID=97481 RepID=A0A1H7YUN6_9PAST|nr:MULTISPECIES: HigA family addiction module antitoxin [Pasteurella]MDP8080017.1 HigA family addiction module antitoxin [Pasteurella skyensis]MDP8085963.1 HigA family addiction module antitoxin [Pasteurella skyensis]MDP8100912.1 HigA family addiction module antitoxin [Pasteurella atlantica]MDP8171281.1 HigA family addiction module antitoxin [Pasteurella skyensis]MDP8175413.1 HigA family addiction module antitoxin [Pasteurella skyensis]